MFERDICMVAPRPNLAHAGGRHFGSRHAARLQPCVMWLHEAADLLLVV